MLQIDKNAMEKRLAMYEDEDRLKSGDSRISSNASSTKSEISRKSDISSKSTFSLKSSENSPYAKQKVPIYPTPTQPDQRNRNSSGERLGSYGTPMNIAPFTINFHEEKVSNLPLPTGDVYSEYRCPRCLEEFEVEATYQSHLEKCIE